MSKTLSHGVTRPASIDWDRSPGDVGRRRGYEELHDGSYLIGIRPAIQRCVLTLPFVFGVVTEFWVRSTAG
jgi:hypothetical protein